MPVEDDTDLLTRLRGREPDAFGEIVAAWSPRMLSLAQAGDAPAAQLVQQAWLTVIERLDTYPGRPGLRAWVFGILIEVVLAGRGLAAPGELSIQSYVDPARFRGPDDKWPGGWTPEGVPAAWDEAWASSAADTVVAALARLPFAARIVVTLGDVCRFTVDDVAGLVGLSPADVRLLLHDGRSRIRAALEERHHETVAVRS
jgi:RNA polymerase sigma-70 factor, ECF subfamily